MVKLIYCAQPGRLPNKKRKVMSFVSRHGGAPLHPFQAFPFGLYEGGPIGREKTMKFCRRLISISDEVWLFGVSEGTLEDLNHAVKIKKPIKLHLEFDPEWKRYYNKLKRKYGYPLGKLQSKNK